jgi:serine/threonine-protein kinase
MTIGPYRLLRCLGQGAQGEVWKADRPGPEVEIVALKVLSPSLARLPKRLAQFRHEAERGARLTGPSLLQVLEFGQIGEFLYMAMPLVEGTTLQQVIRARHRFLHGEAPESVHRMIMLDEERYSHFALRIIAQAARALGRLHSSRVVHRDIKPANILLDCRCACGVYLCDLGLGRDLEHATSEQMRDGAGTPMYMAPERLLKAPADEILCDIYSMGVTLYETLTLERPFHPPESLPASCLSIYLAKAIPRSPCSVKPGLPAELEAVIIKAMARDPLLRYRTADELAADLDQFRILQGNRNTVRAGHASHSGHAPHPGPAEPHTGWGSSRSNARAGTA